MHPMGVNFSVHFWRNIHPCGQTLLTGSFFFIFSPIALLAMFFSLFQLSASNLRTNEEYEVSTQSKQSWLKRGNTWPGASCCRAQWSYRHWRDPWTASAGSLSPSQGRLPDNYNHHLCMWMLVQCFQYVTVICLNRAWYIHPCRVSYSPLQDLIFTPAGSHIPPYRVSYSPQQGRGLYSTLFQEKPP